MTTAKRPPLSKAERQRKIKAIQAEFEAKRRELGMRAPAGYTPAVISFFSRVISCLYKGLWLFFSSLSCTFVILRYSIPKNARKPVWSIKV